MTTCPRCNVSLVERTFHGVELHICPGCTGTLVPQRRLIALLEALSMRMVKRIDPTDDIDPLPERGPIRGCPRCAGPIEHFGYSGLPLAMLDRCTRCQVVWCDVDELGVAALIYARTHAHAVAKQQELEHYSQALGRRFDAIQRARLVQKLLV